MGCWGRWSGSGLGPRFFFSFLSTPTWLHPAFLLCVKHVSHFTTRCLASLLCSACLRFFHPLKENCWSFISHCYFKYYLPPLSFHYFCVSYLNMAHLYVHPSHLAFLLANEFITNELLLQKNFPNLFAHWHNHSSIMYLDSSYVNYIKYPSSHLQYLCLHLPIVQLLLESLFRLQVAICSAWNREDRKGCRGCLNLTSFS